MSGSEKARKGKVHPLRDALQAACITFAVSAIGIAIVYFRAYQSQLTAARSELLQIARTAAAQVDGDLHERVVADPRDGTPDHLKALAPLVRVQAATRDVYDIYTGIQRDGHTWWILDSRRGLAAKAAADADPPMTEYKTPDPETDEVFAKHRELSTNAPRRVDGHTYLSAMAPFFDSRGKFAGVVGVDMVLDGLEARMADIRGAVYVALAAVLTMSIGAGWVALRIRRFTAELVSKLRLARAEAERHARAADAAAKAKANFLAMMSHEIRTPMNGLLGVADLLRGMTADPEQRKLLAILSASGNSLLRIINDILDFSKIEASRLELHPQPFSLRSLLEEIEQLLEPEARAKDLSLIIHTDVMLPKGFNGDRERLSQVLLNLGTNAVKFTDAGEVRIDVRLLGLGEKARLEFSVRDTGIGIGEEAQAHLFSPFTQVAEARRHRTGTGLGLVISQRLVKLMGGTIRVRSTPGHGSTFEFVIELPVADVETVRQPKALGSSDTLKVLVAEDNAINQTIITAMLVKLGHAAHVVPNGRAALEELARESYDLVLMDCNMPVMDGLEATRTLRRAEFGVRDPGVLVVALTANALVGDRETCLDAGMDDFLAKPVTLEALSEMIERVRGMSRAA